MEQSIDFVKKRTLEIYDSMPQDKELRKNCLSERDEIIDLNYKFFGYVASNTYINNTSVTYEDKLQSCLCHFCECFWWYKWKGDDTHKGYRQDLSFTVFFKPRLGEMIERELNEVKYSIRRSLCMEVGAQLGKHWGKVNYDDLKLVDLPVDKMNSLKAIFGSLYIEDIDKYDTYIDDTSYQDIFDIDMNEDFDISIDTDKNSDGEIVNINYDGIENLLIHDMILLQSKLDDDELYKMSQMYDIDVNILKKFRPIAEKHLLKILKEKLDLLEGFND